MPLPILWQNIPQLRRVGGNILDTVFEVNAFV
jgi:hypothetical protein